MLDWNDLKYFVAVARHGSTLAAGRALEVDQSTVQRRLTALERHIGRAVVKRQASGYRLTDFGTEVLEAACRVERAVGDFEQALVVSKRNAAGVIRLTCPEPLVDRLTQSGLLDRFHALHPDLHVEFVMSDRYVDLRTGEADVALRSGDTDDAVLVGRKVGDSLWAVYASRDYVARHGQPSSIEELQAHPLAGFEESMADHRASQWLREVAPDARIVARSGSVLGLLLSVKAGVGMAPLPTALGDSEPELVRVLGPIPALSRDWRLLAMPEIRKTARVSAFFAFMVAEVEALKPIITG
ncbi:MULTISPECIES: LysR family transcriptional regulator [unclassified Variovorax]|uniref:LysR family transcriptional regulator n=1 Tax=unclassified Variovorax TaxID=663243 RepID=UPI00076CFDCE|nr:MULTISPECIES: LysR family transcriptional regulator [unclassified Variovorax]KWT72176.1 transcriptional regulator, LysR family [Variovorax sp. WDL1]PNG58884.1 HTH-type transcriptional regulator DmlR [Variovorax sp. B4]PNG61326.1 HTH-type transcriptional regulator DmlR [Variovorax sp. B2]VTV12680.1 D-malate degradation protein R [Variovorax sp. WDL1]